MIKCKMIDRFYRRKILDATTYDEKMYINVLSLSKKLKYILLRMEECSVKNIHIFFQSTSSFSYFLPTEV